MARTPQPWWRSSHGAWYAKVRGKQVRLDTDHAKAIEFLEQILAREPKRSGLAVPALVERYLEDARHRVKSTTLVTYRDSLSGWARWSGNKEASEVRGADLTAYAATRGWGNTSRNTYLGHIRICLRWAVDQGLLQSYPLGRFRLPPSDRREPIPPEVGDAFRGSIRRHALRDWWDLSVACGARPGELRTLEARQVSGDRRCATVRGKTGKREVWFQSHVADILERLCDKWPSGPVIRNPLGDPWSPQGIGQSFRFVSRKIGHRVVPYHTRPLFAHGRMVAGVDAMTTAKLLGHKSPTTTMRWYAYWTSGDLRAAVDRVG